MFRRDPNRMWCKGLVQTMVVVTQGPTGLRTLRSTQVNEVEQTKLKGS